MKLKTLCLAAVAVLAVAWIPAVAEETIVAPATEVQDPVQDQAEDACLDYTPADETEAQPALLLGPADMQPVTPGCKTCKDQPFCKCTYQGMPRISCDPCCYVNNIGVQICLS